MTARVDTHKDMHSGRERGSVLAALGRPTNSIGLAGISSAA